MMRRNGIDDRYTVIFICQCLLEKKLDFMLSGVGSACAPEGDHDEDLGHTATYNVGSFCVFILHSNEVEKCKNYLVRVVKIK